MKQNEWTGCNIVTWRTSQGCRNGSITSSYCRVHLIRFGRKWRHRTALRYCERILVAQEWANNMGLFLNNRWLFSDICLSPLLELLHKRGKVMANLIIRHKWFWRRSRRRSREFDVKMLSETLVNFCNLLSGFRRWMKNSRLERETWTEQNNNNSACFLVLTTDPIETWRLRDDHSARIRRKRKTRNKIVCRRLSLKRKTKFFLSLPYKGIQLGYTPHTRVYSSRKSEGAEGKERKEREKEKKKKKTLKSLVRTAVFSSVRQRVTDKPDTLEQSNGRRWTIETGYVPHRQP